MRCSCAHDRSAQGRPPTDLYRQLTKLVSSHNVEHVHRYSKKNRPLVLGSVLHLVLSGVRVLNLLLLLLLLTWQPGQKIPLCAGIVSRIPGSVSVNWSELLLWLNCGTIFKFMTCTCPGGSGSDGFMFVGKDWSPCTIRNTRKSANKMKQSFQERRTLSMDDSPFGQMFVQSLSRRVVCNKHSASRATVIFLEHKVRQRNLHSHPASRIQRRRLRVLNRCLRVLVQQ
ncbi:hypothetical protein BDY19DRAFT_256051 [Irpex rosettiformis]|uniref:Uncharacterized protein n=1 Tax=Irpex rosettiformis TaxID=378272 RepID=A0ACB8UGV4_9APHY|nr:hypothetical protein BDY19DRAFT_256051 [Irpex rosettiformis]